eukprot:3792818-Pyramimonas_sp.AAC.1
MVTPCASACVCSVLLRPLGNARCLLSDSAGLRRRAGCGLGGPRGSGATGPASAVGLGGASRAACRNFASCSDLARPALASHAFEVGFVLDPNLRRPRERVREQGLGRLADVFLEVGAAPLHLSSVGSAMPSASTEKRRPSSMLILDTLSSARSRSDRVGPGWA